MSDVTLNVDQVIVERIVKARLEAEVLKAMGGVDSLVDRVIRTILTRKVGSDGRESSYSNDNRYFLMDILVEQAVTKAATDMLKSTLEDRKKHFEQLVGQALLKQNKPLAAAMVQGLVEAVAFGKITIALDTAKKA